jgi:hypothetical protein
MKYAILAVAAFAVLVAGISYNNYLNRDKKHIYTTEEIASQECAKRGGNVVSKVGWDNNIHIQEFKCEGAK